MILKDQLFFANHWKYSKLYKEKNWCCKSKEGFCIFNILLTFHYAMCQPHLRCFLWCNWVISRITINILIHLLPYHQRFTKVTFTVSLHTVKSLLVAAATIFFRGSYVRLLIKGGLYLRAATISNFPKNYVKLEPKTYFLLAKQRFLVLN